MIICVFYQVKFGGRERQKEREKRKKEKSEKRERKKREERALNNPKRSHPLQDDDLPFDQKSNETKTLENHVYLCYTKQTIDEKSISTYHLPDI